MSRHQRGFTLIELLIVVALIGLIVAIATPNLLNAVDRGKQKRTMADLRSMASAAEAYAVDFTLYPVAGDIGPFANSLEPLYLRKSVRNDAWGQDFVVASNGFDYTIASGGKDGPPLNFVGGATSNLTDAIIWSNGQFVQWPDGLQQ